MRIINSYGLNDEYGNSRYITLCHYSMRSWNKSHYASWCLFGHHHGSLEPYGLSFDVGVDCWNFTIWAIDETHAVKIANEYRIQLIETGLWNTKELAEDVCFD